MPHRFTTPPRRGRTPLKPGAVTGQVQSLTRGLNLLEALAKADGGITLTDIAHRVDLPPSTTHRLLSTLEKLGFVYQAGDLGLWYVGLQAFTVGAGFLANRDFVAQSHVYMRRLMEQSGETANLAILDGTEAVFIAQVQCHEMMRILVKLGAFYALGKKKAPYTDLGDLIQALVKAFGPDRCMWESDCPFQVVEGHRYADSIGLLESKLKFLTAGDREWLLRKTAETFFFPA